jgi:hypothetical protein
MGTNIFIGLLLVLIPFGIFAKDIEVAGEFESLQCDNVGYIYATKNNTIYKYNEKGDLLGSYNYNKYGAKPSIDVSVPMRVFLYFSDFKKIIILDSRLTEMRIIDVVFFTEVENPTLACFSKDQNIWMYNATRFTLLKVDNVGNKMYESQNLISLVNQDIVPTKIREQENNVFLTDTSKGILVFDILGTFIKMIPLRHIELFQVKDGKLYYFSEQMFQSVNLKTLENTIYHIDCDIRVKRVLLTNQSYVKWLKDKFVIIPVD